MDILKAIKEYQIKLHPEVDMYSEDKTVHWGGISTKYYGYWYDGETLEECVQNVVQGCDKERK